MLLGFTLLNEMNLFLVLKKKVLIYILKYGVLLVFELMSLKCILSLCVFT